MKTNIEEFYDRINLKSDLSKLSKIICQKYNLGKYLSDEIILVGYEDFNFILTTENGKYCVKIFNKERTSSDVKMYIDRIELANTLDINTPKVYKCNNDILCEISLDNVTFRLCVFEYVDGKSFYDLNEIPTEEEIRNIISQMVKIHEAKLESDFIYDKWAIINFSKEYEEKEKYLDDKYKESFDKLYQRFSNVKLDKLPSSFVHGDIISSNVMKDSNGKLWIIDDSDNMAVKQAVIKEFDWAIDAGYTLDNPDFQVLYMANVDSTICDEDGNVIENYKF